MPSSSDPSPEQAPGVSPQVRQRVLLLVIFTVFLDLVGFGLVVPLLPLYVKSMNASSLVVGFILSFFSVAQLVATPILGKLSDKYGRRKIILLSLAGNAVAMVIFAVAATERMLPLFFLSRVIAGATAGNLSACQAVIADVTTRDDRAGAMGRLGAGIGLGMIVGPVAGGWLGALAPWAPPIAAAVMAILDVIFTFFLMPETRWLRDKRASLDPQKKPEAPGPSIGDVLRERRMALILSLYFLTFIALTNLQTSLALLAHERLGWTEKATGNSFGLFGAISVIVQGALLGRLSKAVGEINLVIIGAIFGIFGMTGIAFAHSSVMLLGSLTVFGFGVAITNPSLSTIASRLAPAEQQGAVLGFAQSAGTLGRTIGPTWSGLLFTYLGSEAPFLSGATAAVLSLGIALSLKMTGSSSAGAEEATVPVRSDDNTHA